MYFATVVTEIGDISLTFNDDIEQCNRTLIERKFTRDMVYDNRYRELPVVYRKVHIKDECLRYSREEWRVAPWPV